MRSPVLLLAALSFAVAACQEPGWTLTVYNNTTQSRVVRVYDGAAHVDRFLAPQAIGFVLILKEPYEGTIEVLEWRSCLVIETITEIPRQHALLIIDPGDDVRIYADDGNAGSKNPLLPQYNGCP